MKKLTKLSLHDLSQAEMAKRELNVLKGGQWSTCACKLPCPCKYAGEKENDNDSFYGGASHDANYKANGGSEAQSLDVYVAAM